MDKLEIMKCKQRSKMVMKERRLLTKLTQLGSKHTVQLFMSFVDSQNLYLVQEICIFGTLAAIRQQHRLPIEKIRSYSAQILTGIEFMHHYSIVHCDLKPENIMVQTVNSCLRAVSFPPRKNTKEFQISSKQIMANLDENDNFKLFLSIASHYCVTFFIF